MKRFAVTAFAVLYAALVIGTSVDRMQGWLDRHAAGVSKPAGDLHVGKPEKVTPRSKQTRILESQFVVEPPQIAYRIALAWDSYSCWSESRPVEHQAKGRIPSRAPPALI